MAALVLREVYKCRLFRVQIDIAMRSLTVITGHHVRFLHCIFCS